MHQRHAPGVGWLLGPNAGQWAARATSLAPRAAARRRGTATSGRRRRERQDRRAPKRGRHCCVDQGHSRLISPRPPSAARTSRCGLIGEGNRGNTPSPSYSPRAARGRHCESVGFLKSAPKRRATADRRPLHNDEARSLQVLDKALGDDRRHEFVGIVDPLAALKRSANASASARSSAR
jgi:hypothetical protein